VSHALRLTTTLACLFAVLSAAYAALHQDWTYDEPFHLGWSERLLTSGETERASQERYNSKTPAAIPNALARRAAVALGVTQPRALRLAARLPTVAWLALLLATTFLAARRVAGETAAHVATIGAALDPSLIAHGSLATVDVLYALATLLSLLAALALARAPSLGRAAALGLALGLAFATKFSAFLLLLGLPFLPLAAPGEARGFWRSFWRAGLCVLIAAALAIAVVDAAYLGRGVFLPLQDARLQSRALGWFAHAAPELRLPLPASFLEGLDRSLGSERGWGPVVLLGRSHEAGVFYYFVVLWALKTPLLLLLAQAAGLLVLARSGSLARDPALRFLALNLALTLLYFSLLFKTQIGYRFVLMCVPLMWLLAAAGLSRLDSRRARSFGVLAVLVAVAESAFYVGNPLAFTNAAVQPKRQAFRLLADSSIDWGQNRDKVQGWLAARGIRGSRLDPVHLLPGPNVLSLNVAAGVFDFDQHRWLRDHADPVAHMGHTYLRFEVDDETFERFMNAERRLAAGATNESLCGEELDYQTKAPGTQVPFVREEAPEPDRVWVACVRNERSLDLGFRVMEGRVRAGLLTAGGRCDAELLQDDQVSWRRLDPGTHALCAIEVPNRRPFLAYRVEAAWIIRGQAASLNVRPLTTDAGGIAGPAGARK